MLVRYLIASLALSVALSTGVWNDAHLHRNGLLLVEVADVTITGDDGSGSLGGYDAAKGWYAAYATKDGYNLGDRVLSVFVYNPATNLLDDVILRYDIIMERRK